MQRRHYAMLAGLAVTAMTVGVGCPDDNAGNDKPAPKPKPTAAATTAATAATAAATGGTAAAAPTGDGTIKGVVKFTGKPLEMNVPTARKKADFCKSKDVKYNSVLVKDGKLQDVLVRIAVGEVKGKFTAPTAHASMEQQDCMYTPRIQGVVADQQIDIKNMDGTAHNVHTYKGSETLFNQAQPQSSPMIQKSWDDGLIKFTCDVHPWMRGFVVVTDHPFFAVSKADGSYEIGKIPAGKYNVEAWHSEYGLKKGSVEVADGKPATWDIEFTDKDSEPAENKDETKGLW